MVGRQHQRFRARELRRLDDEAVLAGFDPDAEGAQRGDGGRDAVGVLVLELLRIADDGSDPRPGRPVPRAWEARRSCSGSKEGAADFDAAKLAPGLDDDPADRLVASHSPWARSRCLAPIACSVRTKPMRVSLMPTSSITRRRGRGLATTQAIGNDAVEMSPGRVRSKAGSRSGGVMRTVVSVSSTATPR